MRYLDIHIKDLFRVALEDLVMLHLPAILVSQTKKLDEAINVLIDIPREMASSMPTETTIVRDFLETATEEQKAFLTSGRKLVNLHEESSIERQNLIDVMTIATNFNKTNIPEEVLRAMMESASNLSSEIDLQRILTTTLLTKQYHNPIFFQFAIDKATPWFMPPMSIGSINKAGYQVNILIKSKMIYVKEFSITENGEGDRKFNLQLSKSDLVTESRSDDYLNKTANFITRTDEEKKAQFLRLLSEILLQPIYAAPELLTVKELIVGTMFDELEVHEIINIISNAVPQLTNEEIVRSIIKTIQDKY